MKSAIIALASALVLAVALPAAAGDVDSLKKVDAAYNAAQDPAKMASFLTDDARYMGPSSGFLKGKKAIADRFKVIAALPGFSSEGETEEAVIKGDAGITLGATKAALTVDGGKTVLMPGKYLRIWVHADGGWKLAAEFMNLIPGAEEVK